MKPFIDNPFLDSYLLEELAFYSLPKPYEAHNMKVKLAKAGNFNFSDYLNKNFRDTEKYPLFPQITVDGIMWMSLTYMELQSMYLSIVRAHSRCATTGLGLGYYPLRIANKKEVESVDVYERDARVIEFFLDTFSDRPELEKINIIKGDVYKTLKNKEYDFFFADHYPTLLGDECITDIKYFTKHNRIFEYHFWGEEKIILNCINEHLEIPMTFIEREYFRTWFATPIFKDRSETMSDFFEPTHDQDFLRKAARVLRSLRRKEESLAMAMS